MKIIKIKKMLVDYFSGLHTPVGYPEAFLMGMNKSNTIIAAVQLNSCQKTTGGCYNSPRLERKLFEQATDELNKIGATPCGILLRPLGNHRSLSTGAWWSTVSYGMVNYVQKRSLILRSQGKKITGFYSKSRNELDMIMLKQID